MMTSQPCRRSWSWGLNPRRGPAVPETLWQDCLAQIIQAVAIATPRPLYPRQMSTPGAGSCTCG